MFHPTIQSLLVGARVEELHRIAQTSNRRSAVAARIGDVKRALGHVFDGGRAGTDEPAAIHGVQLVGHPSTTNWNRS